MKYFVVSDVHGFYNEMIEALNSAGFETGNPNHTFISLGDLFDRGPDSRKCLDFVNSLERKILIRGNHEDLLEAVIKRRGFIKRDYHNKTDYTIYQLGGKGSDMWDKVSNDLDLNKYLNSTINYYETKNYVFCHGWIPVKATYDLKTYKPIGGTFYKNWRNAKDKYKKNMPIYTDWYNARWLNGMEMWNMGVRLKKTIVCGHYETSYGHKKIHKVNAPYGSVFIDDGIIAIDATTVISGFVNCIVLND